MDITRRILIVLFVAGILLTSCSGQGAVSATPDVNAILTAGVGTLAASIFQTHTAMVPPPTLTFTATAIPTETPQPSPIPSSTALTILNPTVIIVPTGTQNTITPNPNTLGFGCNNLQLIGDETIPTGTVMAPEQLFTKTWKVANTGTCDWVYLYHLVSAGGNSMGAEPPRLGKVIEPGKWTQLSLDLLAPKAPGTYTGYWRLADQSGNAFGSTLGVSIVVKASYP